MKRLKFYENTTKWHYSYICLFLVSAKVSDDLQIAVLAIEFVTISSIIFYVILKLIRNHIQRHYMFSIKLSQKEQQLLDKTAN